MHWPPWARPECLILPPLLAPLSPALANSTRMFMRQDDPRGRPAYLRSGWNRLAVVSSAASAIALLVAAGRSADVHRASFLVGTLSARCLDMVRLLGCVPQFSHAFDSMTRYCRPSGPGRRHFPPGAWRCMGRHAAVGRIHKSRSRPVGGTEPFYWLLNFNTYYESMVTLFVLIVVNN